MMRAIIVLLACVCSVSAFVNTNVARSSIALNSFAGGLPGADGPEPGSKNFDPLKLAEQSPQWVPFFREAEIKHGRIAMLATLGWIAGDFGHIGNVNTASSFTAHNDAVTSGAMVQILIWTSLLEHISIPAVQATMKGERAPGYFGFDPLGFGKDPANFKKLEVNELKNGRLAMLAFGGIATQAALGHTSFPYL